MKLLHDFKKTINGFFITSWGKLTSIETRAQRQKRMRDERRKQLMDSFNADGYGYHKQKGWF